MGAAPRRGLGVAGDRDGRAGVGARTRQSARRHPNGARPRRYGAIPDRSDGLRASAIDPKSRARIPCFQGLAAGFPGGRNCQGASRSGTCQTPRRRCGPRRASKDARLSTGFCGMTIQANVGRPGSRGSPCRPSGSPRRRTRGASPWSHGTLPFRSLRFSNPSCPRMWERSGAERRAGPLCANATGRPGRDSGCPDARRRPRPFCRSCCRLSSPSLAPCALRNRARGWSALPT